MDKCHWNKDMFVPCEKMQQALSFLGLASDKKLTKLVTDGDVYYKCKSCNADIRMPKQLLVNKFLVINYKRFAELNEVWRARPNCIDKEVNAPTVDRFFIHLGAFVSQYEEMTGKKMNQKYISINQDEPYAESIIKIILENETD